MKQTKRKQLQAVVATAVIIVLVVAPMMMIGIDALLKTLKL